MKYFYIIIISFFLTFCTKDKYFINPNQGQPLIPYEPCYSKFLGNYKVLNTDSNTYYNMSITHFKDTNQFGNIMDYLFLKNFANKFDLKTAFQCTIDSNGNNNYLDIGAHDSTYDHSGYRWFLFPFFEDSLGQVEMSLLKNDTLYLYFYMCNIKFYIYDAQPYYCKNVMQIGIKQH